MAITTERTVDELKVILNGTISQYNNLSSTDKKGTVFFDRNNKAVYVEGILASSNVRDIEYTGTLLTITFIDGSTIPIEMSVTDALTTLKETLETWSNNRFVRFDEKLTGTAALTTAQKENARKNIEAVKAEEGKGLSTEDFTTALKEKLEGLSNYDDTELENAITTLTQRFDTLLGSENGDVDDIINTFNEIVAFLDNIKETDTLEGVLQGISDQFDGLGKRIKTLEDESKVESINDLSGKVTIKGEQALIDDTDDDGSGEITCTPIKVSNSTTAKEISLGIDREGALGILAMALQKAANTSLDGWVRFDNIDIYFTPTSGDDEAHITMSSTPKVWKLKEQ